MVPLLLRRPLLERAALSAEELLAQAPRWLQRCFSSVGASCSAAPPGAECASRGRGGAPASPPALPPAAPPAALRRLPALLRNFSAAAAAAAAPSVAVPAASTSTRAGSGDGAPWPWVDPSLPRVLPVSVGAGRQRETAPLEDALQRLLDQLRPGQRKAHSLEVFVRFCLDPRRSDHLVRGSVVLPYGLGRTVRLVVFAKGEDADTARREGVELIGDDDLIARIVAAPDAPLPFDRLIATPDFARALARAGRVLGPKGLMPNPKTGTLTTDVVRAIRDVRRGRLDFRLGRDACVRSALGRAAMPHAHLAANAGALVAALLECRPKGAGGGGKGGAGAGGGGAADKGKDTDKAAGGELDGYVRTFLLKTTCSAPIAITHDSLLAAAQAHRAAAAAAEEQAGGGGDAGGAPGAAAVAAAAADAGAAKGSA